MGLQRVDTTEQLSLFFPHFHYVLVTVPGAGDIAVKKIV